MERSLYVFSALVMPFASLCCLSHGSESAYKAFVTKICVRRGRILPAWQMGTRRHRWGFMT